MAKKFSAKSTADEVLSGINLKGKRFLITGASSGIGLETARSLVAHGASVVGAVRNLAKAEPATASVRDAALQGGGSLELINLDHFALINGIEPLLADNGRLVVLSSLAHRGADIDLDDPNFEQQAYDPWVAYSRSKTANSLFAVEFDRRHRDRGIRAASAMPGNSLTNLPRHFSQEELQGLLQTVDAARTEAGLPPQELKEIPQAAATSVWAAVVANKDEIGEHYLEDCAIAPINDTPNPFADGVRSYALDVNKAKQLWAKSEELISAAS
ncbi:SDR family NAD(P)-dependent oxidoreductase [Pseudanabaena sp. FACHB-2040]|uniref:SDR family NAD(P)-dependent oxidoreductase n=1 Tax=Pseudanabaena sp. FACHB-2040 TaxID=2692859 RepID=UPI00168745B6|nr:SDR family NAD(P)-dependent oxidoreductase [Pseudanabaena sp. FACHB-2040]MBD2261345.1 SDR family NAD(P)-dependent oxidoreductase [Pseudanabaena sp. FACHB-2040]